MLLIYPPVAKPCEPPAGLAKLAGALKNHKLNYKIIDANLEALFSRLGGKGESPDKWTQRAKGHLSSNLTSLFNGQAFNNIDRYKRTVVEINRVVQMAKPELDGKLSLVNFEDHQNSPVRSSDLLRAAEHPEQNPFFGFFRTRLDELTNEYGPSLVGFSLNYLSQALCSFAMAGYLRKKAPELKIILGGGLVTSWLAKTGWHNPFKGLIDELISGPGEGPLLLGQGIKKTQNAYPPDYSPFTDHQYFSPGFILPYSTSSGCFWNRCSFCPESFEGNLYRPIPPSQVMADIKILLQETQPVLLHLVDNALSPNLLHQLAGAPLPIPWYGFVRISEELTDQNFCLALRHSGCVMLKLGLESGDQTVLDRMNKGITLEEVSKVLKNLKRAGIISYVYLLFGTPAENLTRARSTLDFTTSHSQEIGFLNLAIFNLPISSPEAEHLDTEEFYEGDLSLYRQFRHPHGWGRQVVRQFLDKEFKRHPAVAAILRREPPFFTSNHAPFFQSCTLSSSDK